MRINLQNRTLKIAINHNPPYVLLNWNDQLKVWQAVGGLEVQILNTLKSLFNFSYEIINCHNDWGTKLPNGTWVGAVGLVSSNKADLGIGGISLTYDRSKVVPYIYAHASDSVTFVTKTPEIKPNTKLILEPFNLDVWLCLIFSIVACMIFDQLCKHYSKSGHYRNVLWVSMYSMFRQQIYRFSTLTASHQVWNLFWTIGVFILTTAYAGCLYSLLSIPIKIKTIDTVNELIEAAERNEIAISGLNRSSFIKELQVSKISNHVKLARVFRSCFTKKQCIKELLKSNEKLVFISKRNSLRYYQLVYGEEYLYLSPDNHESSIFYDISIIPCSPSFPYATQFDFAILWLDAGGFIMRWRTQEFNKVRSTNKKIPTESNRINLNHMIGIFFVYFITAAASITCFIFELVYYTLANKNRFHKGTNSLYKNLNVMCTS